MMRPRADQESSTRCRSTSSGSVGELEEAEDGAEVGEALGVHSIT
jgi:hypothetical protein